MASFQRQLELHCPIGESHTACLTWVTAQVPKLLSQVAPMFVSKTAVGCGQLTAALKGCSCHLQRGQHSCSFPMPSNIKCTLRELNQRAVFTEKYPRKTIPGCFLLKLANCTGSLWHEKSKKAQKRRRGGMVHMGMGMQGGSQV